MSLFLVEIQSDLIRCESFVSHSMIYLMGGMTDTSRSFVGAVRYVAHNGGRSVEIFEYLRLVKVDKGTVPGLLARMCARRKQAGSPQITYLATGPT